MSEKEKVRHLCDWMRLFGYHSIGHFLRPFLATDWPVPPGSRLFGVFLLFRFLGGGDFLCAVQERAQCHPAEHVSVGLLDELHQLADVAVQTL